MKDYTLKGFLSLQGDNYPQLVFPVYKGEDDNFYIQDPPEAERIQGFKMMSQEDYGKLLVSGHLVELDSSMATRVVSIGNKQIYGIRKSPKKVTFASKQAALDELIKAMVEKM